MHFTGQLRDGPLNLDQFPARNYAGVFGHWHTPDPAGLAAADPGNPQTWNRYAYVANNPLSNTDPLGLEIESCWGFDCGGVGGGGGCMGFTDGAGYPGENCGPYTVYLPVGPGGGGGGGGGSAPRPPSPPPGGGGNHGPWPGNQTTGLPQLPTQPLSLGDLMSFTPGAVTPDEIGLGTTICVVQPEVCVAGIITIGVIVYAPQIVSAIQQTISQSQTQAAPSTTTNNSQPCVPPAGTKCYETQSGHTHNGWGPHSHIWTRNQVPSTGKCFWNRGGGTQGTTQFPPAGMQSCSTYSTWPNN
jgi:RHS repeat-associated protein